MSEQNIPIPVDPIALYEDLQTRAAAIDDKLAAYTDPTIVEAFKLGRDAIGQQIADVRAELTNQYTQVTNGVADLEMLRGILPDDVLSAKGDELTARMQRLSSYVLSENIAVETVAAEPEVKTLQAEPSIDQSSETVTQVPETSTETDHPLNRLVLDALHLHQEQSEPVHEIKLEKTKIALELMAGPSSALLRVGKRGRTYPLSKRTQESHVDYTPYRRAALEFMVNNQGRDIRPEEIWVAMAGDTPFSGVIMSQTRRWLAGVQFRNKPLFLHNGRRSWGSRYKTNPDVDLQLKITDATENPLIDIIGKALDEEIYIPAPSATKVEPEIIVAPEVETHTEEEKIGPEHDTPTIESFIPIHSAALFVAYLDLKRGLLEALSIPAPSKELATSITEANEQRALFEGLSEEPKTHEEITTERLQTMRTLRAILGNEETFDALLMSVNEDDVIYPLIEYLMDIDGEETWEILLNQVLFAETEAMRDVGFSGHMKESQKSIITILPNGRKFEQLCSVDGTPQPYREVGGLETPYFTGTPELEDEVLAGAMIAGMNNETESDNKVTDDFFEDVIGRTNKWAENIELTTRPEVTSIDEAPSVRSKNISREHVNEKMQNRLDSARITIEDRNAPLDGTIQHLANYFPWVTPGNFAEALKSSVVPRRQGNPARLNLEDIVRIGLWSADKNTYSLRQRRITIDKAVHSFIDAISELREPKAN